MKTKFLFVLGLCLFLLNCPQLVHGQSTRNVAIFIYEGVEVLDFAGPGEVFAATALNGRRPFNVYTVAAGAEPILSQGFVEVTPEFTIENCPAPDILVLPGGSTGRSLRNENVIRWIQNSAHDLEVAMSVCTGAALLAKAGLLDGKHATTWWGYVDRFEKSYPDIIVHKDKRFVDNGKMVTTAGVSAGIDGALHVVAKLLGEQTARATARYMEYDKWEPQAGLILESDFITELKKGELGKALRMLEAAQGGNSHGQPFYAGQLNDIGYTYLEDGRVEDALKIFEINLEKHPYFVVTHAGLAEAYSVAGQREKATEHYKQILSFDQSDLDAVDKLGLKAALMFFESLKQEKQLDERQINLLGYKLLNQDRPGDAIAVFKFNVAAFPNSANTYDSLGEAYMKTGENEPAIRNYKKSLELDPDNRNAAARIKRLRD